MTKYKVPSVDELFEAGVHYGHQVKRWHPKMSGFIYGSKSGIHIIDLEDTKNMMEKACEVLFETAKKGQPVVLVGTKRQAREIVQVEAKRSGAKSVSERWLGGTITNFRMIKKNIDKYLSMVSKREAGDYSKYTKKERLLIDRDVDRLYKSIGGIIGLKDLPGAMVVVDVKKEKTAIREARNAKIPVIGLCDTNSDPSTVDYAIPANDDAIKSVAIILKTLADAIEEGYKEFEKLSVEKPAEPKIVKEEAKEEVKEDIKKPEKLKAQKADKDKDDEKKIGEKKDEGKKVGENKGGKGSTDETKTEEVKTEEVKTGEEPVVDKEDIQPLRVSSTDVEFEVIDDPTVHNTEDLKTPSEEK